MKRKKYNYSDKCKARDLAKVKWDRILLAVQLEEEGLGVEEIGKKMGISHQRVSVLLERARKGLPE